MPAVSKSGITVEEARTNFAYDPLTGKVMWKVESGKTAFKEAGYIKNNGYRYVGFNYFNFTITTIIWLIVYGKFPEYEIDHIDGNTLNNKLENLRDVNKSQNAANAKLSVSSTTGHKGVCRDKNRGKWMAHITVNYRLHNLGRFDTVEEAIAARKEAEQKFFGEFAR